MKPLLLLDVDGPLNPYHARRVPKGYTTHQINGFNVRLNPDHGPALHGLPFELVWATTWEHKANQLIGPRLGLPELPVIEWPPRPEASPIKVYFKTPTIVDWAAGRPFAWMDDEITRADRRWVTDHHPGPALLRWVDPGRGLTRSDFDALTAWAEETTRT